MIERRSPWNEPPYPKQSMSRRSAGGFSFEAAGTYRQDPSTTVQQTSAEKKEPIRSQENKHRTREKKAILGDVVIVDAAGVRFGGQVALIVVPPGSQKRALNEKRLRKPRSFVSPIVSVDSRGGRAIWCGHLLPPHRVDGALEVVIIEEEVSEFNDPIIPDAVVV